MRKTGSYIVIGNNQYFIPDPLPPANPPLKNDDEMVALYGEAMGHLSKLNEMARRLPHIEHLVKAYIIKEAQLTSAIENIHTTLLEVFTQPLLESKPTKDTQLVINYREALRVACAAIKQEGLPVSSRVILAAHKALLQGEDYADPGHYRQQAVRVGNLVPAPPGKVAQLMGELEVYIHNADVPALIKAGFVHQQFETIHPFLDGNGRIGRLLIVLLLMEADLLTEPILYISYYFKKNRLQYYHWLDRVRTHGDFEGWIKFYLTAVQDSSIDAYRRAQDIEDLYHAMKQRIMHDTLSNKLREVMLRALNNIFASPVMSINALRDQLGISYNSAQNIINYYVACGFLVEITQQKRGKLFKFEQYIALLEKEYAYPSTRFAPSGRSGEGE